MEPMSGDTFAQNLSAIITDVDKLITDETDRRRARLLAVYEHAAGHQGELIAEVLRTSHGPVVVARTTVEDSAENIRQDSRRNVEPLTDDPGHFIDVVSRRRAQFCLRTTDLIGWIADGRRKIVIRPGWTVRRTPIDHT